MHFKDMLSAVMSKENLDTLIKSMCFSHKNADWEAKTMACHAISYANNNTGDSSSLKATVRMSGCEDLVATI